jgi:hypothetical protein
MTNLEPSHSPRSTPYGTLPAHRNSLIGYFANVFGRNMVLFALLVFLAVSTAKLLGLRSAQDKEEFYLLNGVENSVVVSIDGEILVSANFDPKTKTLTGAYVVRKLSDGKPWSLRLERVGPLKSFSKANQQ